MFTHFHFLENIQEVGTFFCISSNAEASMRNKRIFFGKTISAKKLARKRKRSNAEIVETRRLFLNYLRGQAFVAQKLSLQTHYYIGPSFIIKRINLTEAYSRPALQIFSLKKYKMMNIFCLITTQNWPRTLNWFSFVSQQKSPFVIPI